MVSITDTIKKNQMQKHRLCNIFFTYFYSSKIDIYLVKYQSLFLPNSPFASWIRLIILKTITQRIRTINPRTNWPQKGAVTHHQDHVIWPISFSTTNTTRSTSQRQRPPPRRKAIHITSFIIHFELDAIWTHGPRLKRALLLPTELPVRCSGMGGVEPSSRAPKTLVLPLHYIPIQDSLYL